MIRWVSLVGFLLPASSGALISDQEADAITEVFHNCKCMYSHQCDEGSNAVNQDFSSIIQPRIHTGTSRIACRGSVPYKRVCCKANPDAGSQTITPTVPNAMTCGFTKSSTVSGTGASDDDPPPSDGDFPWMAAIFVKTSGDYKFRCGGSLIHPKVVLTAAHCVYKGDPATIRVVVNGKIKLSHEEAAPEEKRRVSRIVRHPKYDNASLVNDAALLILEEAFGPRDENTMNILCLPSVDVRLEGAGCLVAGWGKNELETVRETMKKVKLPFVNHDRCQALLRKTALGRFFVLDKSFLCAGGETGKDACGGDGGGPLMCSMSSEGKRYFQAGIVALGVGCGYRDIPGVYTNVAEVLDWIKGELKNRNLDV